MSQRITGVAASACLLLGASGGSYAQKIETQRSESAAAGGLEEIVVTARKRTENLQDVPLSITAFSADQIAKQSIQGLGDIAARTPGLSFENYGGSLGTPVIRGQTQNVLTNPVQNVASFFNGIYLQRAYMVDASLLGVQQVEILKGPQSALYGRNAFSGAINYTTRKPDLNHVAGSLTVTGGSDKRGDVSGYISVPGASGRLGIMLGAGYKKFDGTWPNDHPLANAGLFTDGKLGGYKQKLAFASVVYNPTDELSFDGEYSYANSEKEAAPLITRSVAGLASGVNAAGIGVNNMNCSLPGPGVRVPTQSTTPVLFCGELPTSIELAPGEVRNGQLIVDPRAVGYKGTTNLLALNAGYAINAAWSLKYTFGNTKGSSFVLGAPARNSVTGVPAIPFVTTSLAGVPLPPGPNFGYLRNGSLNVNTPGLPGLQTTFDSRPNGNLFSHSHELRLNFAGDALIKNALIGFYTSDAEDNEDGESYWAAANSTDRPRLLTLNLPGAAALGLVNQKTDTNVNAIYGAISLKFTDSLGLDVEGRYTDEKIRQFDLFNLTAGSPTQLKLSDTYFTPRVAFSWRLNTDVKFYLSGARGYKSGGFNGNTFCNGSNAACPAGATYDQRQYKPETNVTYELGAKTEWLDHRLKLNGAIFLVDWKDLQNNVARFVAAGTPISALVIGNLKGADSKGVELESTFQATDALRLDLGLSYADTTFKGGSTSDRYRINEMCDNIICPANGSIAGNQIQRAPKTKANGAVEYAGMMAADWKYNARLEATYQAKQFLDEMNIAWVPARTLLNAALSFDKNQFSVLLWGRNLADKRYLANSLVLVGTNGARTTSLASFYGEQREIGVTVSYKFDGGGK